MRVDAGKADAVVNAHATLAGGSDLGTFPLPDLAAVFAAEIVRMMLKATGYEGTFAVSVSHVYSVDSNQSNFVRAARRKRRSRPDQPATPVAAELSVIRRHARHCGIRHLGRAW